MKNILCTLLASLWLSHISAICISLGGARTSTENRHVAACGDPNLAVTYYEAYSDELKAHFMNTRPIFVNEDSEGYSPSNIDGAAFIAWKSPGQPGTVPFYKLYNPKTTDFVYTLSTDGSPPTISGFGTANIVSYVYPTQCCGSVPLYGASTPGDHWYTTSLAEHNELVNTFGWTDAGVAAYVLPPK